MENPYCRCFNAPKKRSRAAILQPDAGVDASTAASTMGWARIAESGGWIPGSRGRYTLW